MVMIVLSVAVVVFLIAVLAIYLYLLGGLLNRIADNLDDCLQSVRTIGMHASEIGPGVIRLNRTGKALADALPLLAEGAESLVAATSAPPEPARQNVGYMDVAAPQTGPRHAQPAVTGAGMGYLDT